MSSHTANAVRTAGAGHDRPRDEGFSLIEVLVALVVLSVGLLGLAALQSTAAQFNAGAYTRSQATILAYDMADRIRANRAAAQNGDYNSGFAGVLPACNAVVGGTVAQQDLGAWRRALACSLPSGNGAVACDCGPGGTQVLTITVQWDESNREANVADQTQTFVMRTGL